MSTAIATAISTTETHRHEDYIEGEKLGDQITELCGNLYAATYRLLVLIHEFDEQGYWQLPGLCSRAHWLNFKWIGRIGIQPPPVLIAMYQLSTVPE